MFYRFLILFFFTQITNQIFTRSSQIKQADQISKTLSKISGQTEISQDNSKINNGLENKPKTNNSHETKDQDLSLNSSKSETEITNSNLDKNNLVKIQEKENSHTINLDNSLNNQPENFEQISQNQMDNKPIKIHENFDNISIPIKVLLDHKNKQEEVNWKLESESGFIILDPKKNNKRVTRTNLLEIKLNKNRWLINGHGYESENLFIYPRPNLKTSSKEGHIKFENFTYDGIFSLTLKEKENIAYLVNHLDLEDYVASVIKSESWPGWPDEINKAFSICFRSYAISKVLEQRQIFKKKKKAYPFDIKNSNHHQVYKGCTNTEPFKKLVEQTKGIVLTYDNQPIVAMFDISCGGILPSNLSGLDFKRAPYLSRSYPCTYCKNYPYTNWTDIISLTNFQKILDQEYKKIGQIKDIKVTKKDAAGVAQEILVKCSLKDLVISAKKFKNLIKNLKSLCFNLNIKNNNLVITGKGYGHLVGLCQRGAHTMVTQGWNYKDILKFYYPGTALMQLKTDTNRSQKIQNKESL